MSNQANANLRIIDKVWNLVLQIETISSFSMQDNIYIEAFTYLRMIEKSQIWK